VGVPILFEIAHEVDWGRAIAETDRRIRESAIRLGFRRSDLEMEGQGVTKLSRCSFPQRVFM
jgi:hypothetical protein